ncbi:hypothetical protein STCU_10036 [Strigomonas culicis]|uniref:Uncharacterized protein n=1 Tax=Strigomonas culicis TaxID=28005 RepID=S9UUZ0_9TRYP|nr:hypothetical protein STCU_10036 [Strigomonas culicis]|eukprot:EPY18341.1 hypothetical protein STCU_10036 [Strigomonas culicis]
MAAFNERLAKTFGATKRNFRKFYKKMLKKYKSVTEDNATENTSEKEIWKKSFVRTKILEDNASKEQRSDEEDDEPPPPPPQIPQPQRAPQPNRSQKPQPHAAPFPQPNPCSNVPPRMHPCTYMTPEQRLMYYERFFGMTLKTATWVDSPRWRTLDAPRRHSGGAVASNSRRSSSSSNVSKEADVTNRNECPYSMIVR